MSLGRFTHSVVLDDTMGYFVIGGGKYIGGVEGYFGPFVYHRNRMSPHSLVTFTSSAFTPPSGGPESDRLLSSHSLTSVSQMSSRT